MPRNGFTQISLFGKMQRGKSPSFELFQLDVYEGLSELLSVLHKLLLNHKASFVGMM